MYMPWINDYAGDAYFYRLLVVSYDCGVFGAADLE